MKRLSYMLSALLALNLGCAKEVTLQLSLLVNGCDDGQPNPPPSPLASVTDFRFLMTVNGVVQAPIDVAEANLATKLPLVPFDVPLRIDVFGLAGAGASTALSVGSTGDFTIPSATSPNTVALSVVMRHTDAFAGTPEVATQASSSPTCAGLVTPRAYHAQTLLTDGRVLIYGGVQLPTATPVDWSLVFGIPAAPVAGTIYLDDSEIFDPSTGLFSPEGTYLNSGVDPDARAFGSLLASRQVVGGAILVGGETPSDAGASALVGASNGAYFTPTDGGEWQALGFKAGAHGHGCVATDTAGHAMVAGGLSESGSASAGGEALDLTTWLPTDVVSSPGPVTEARADQACSGVEGLLGSAVGALVGEAGGFTTDSSGENAQILSDLYFYQFFGTKFAPLANSNGVVVDLPLLSGPRTRAKAAAISVVDTDTSKPTDAILVTGGLTCDVFDGGSTCAPTFALDGGSAGQLGRPIASYFPAAMGTTELLAFPIVLGTDGGETANPTIFPGPALSPRVDQCEVGLGDGRALVLGGLGPLSDGGFGTLASAVVTSAGLSAGASVVVPTLVPVANSLRQARAGMACTLLQDGSVLVTGGYQTVGPLVNGTAQRVQMLSTAEVYRPIPLSATTPLGQ